MRDPTSPHSSRRDGGADQPSHRAPPKSSAIFARARPGDVHIRQKAFGNDALLTNDCIGCGTSHDVRPRLLSRLSAPEWYILGAAGLWGAFLVFAAQAPDFLWYHSTHAKGLYALLVTLCVNWTTTLPFVFLGCVGVGALFFTKAPWVSLCGTCQDAQTKATRNLRLTIIVGSILVVLSSYLLLSTFKLPVVLASVVVVPIALGAIYVIRNRNAAVRFSTHPATEGVVTMHGGPSLLHVLRSEIPEVLAPAPSGRRWAAAAVSALVFGASISIVAYTTEGQLSCPPGTRMMDRTDDGSTQKWCETSDRKAHGRYIRTDNNGKLAIVGGFNHGTPTGLWLDFRFGQSEMVDEHLVSYTMSTVVPDFDGLTIAP